MKKALHAAAALLIGVVGLFVLTTPAVAAPGTATEITDWRFTTAGVLTDSQYYSLEVEWRAVAQIGAVPTISMAFGLPAELTGQATNFQIRDANNVVSGDCVVTATNVTCTLLDSYVTANPNNIKGKFTLNVRLAFGKDQVPVEMEKSVTIAGVTHPVIVKPVPPVVGCVGDACIWEPATLSTKRGWYDESDNTIRWTIAIASRDLEDSWIVNADGSMPAGLEITVEDFVQPGQSIVPDKGGLYGHFCMRHEVTGSQRPASYTNLTNNEEVAFTRSNGGATVSFTTIAAPANGCAQVTNPATTMMPDNRPAPFPLEGGVYELHIWTKNDNAHLGGLQTFHNEAKITVGTKYMQEIEWTQNYQVAGGSAGGDINNAVAATPTVNVAACTADTKGETVWETVTTPPNNTDYFSYAQTETNRVVTITATPVPGAKAAAQGSQPEGWTLNADGTLTWTYGLMSQKCDEDVAPVLPKMNKAECTVDTYGETVWETLTKPDNGNGLTYGDVKVSDSKVATLVATPATGYAIDGSALPTGWTLNADGTATYTYQLQSEKCDDAVAPVLPKIDPASCTAGTSGKTVWETLAKPADGNGLTYGDVSVDAAHVATVTATPEKGYAIEATKLPAGWELNADGNATYTYQLQSEKCDDAALASTGSGTPLVVGIGALTLLSAGAAALLLARRGMRAEH